jgi:hypothetical protein
MNVIKNGKFEKQHIEEIIQSVLIEHLGNKKSIAIKGLSKKIMIEVLNGFTDALKQGYMIRLHKLFSITMYTRKVGTTKGKRGDKTKTSTLAWTFKPTAIIREKAIKYLYPEINEGKEI